MTRPVDKTAYACPLLTPAMLLHSRDSMGLTFIQDSAPRMVGVTEAAQGALELDEGCWIQRAGPGPAQPLAQVCTPGFPAQPLPGQPRGQLTSLQGRAWVWGCDLEAGERSREYETGQGVE